MISRRDRNRARTNQPLPNNEEIDRQQREMAAAQYAAFQKQQKKSADTRRGCIGLIVIVLAIAVIAGVTSNKKGTTSGSSSSGSGNYSAPAQPSTHSITYKVSGTTKSASLTYENAQGGTQQEDVTLPWSKSFDFPASGFNPFYMAAQNKQDSGTIACEVLEDGKQVKTSTSSGGYVIASCSGNP